MRRDLAIQMLAATRENLRVVGERAEAVQVEVFNFDADETIAPFIATQIDNLYDRAMDARRRTEYLDHYEEPDND